MVAQMQNPYKFLPFTFYLLPFYLTNLSIFITGIGVINPDSRAATRNPSP
jgi:hypothetical protein